MSDGVSDSADIQKIFSRLSAKWSRWLKIHM